MKKVILLSITTLILMASVGYIFRDSLMPLFFMAQRSPEGMEGVSTDANDNNISEVANNLNIPWDMVFLPDESILLTERSGRIVHINGDIDHFVIDEVWHTGEGGLLGIELHPDFANNRYLYIYLTHDSDAGRTNSVVKYTFSEEGLSDRLVVLDSIPGNMFHNGGRLSFGPDDMLYITTGDALEPSLAQDTDSLAGKILRVTDEGEIPTDNPFGNEVYSYGHRNPQGLAWDDDESLWATEHGDGARDELNLIEAGFNYGWPEIEGMQEASNMQTPVMYSGDEYTWAPSGATYHDGRIFFAGLRGNAIYEIDLDESSIRSHFKEEYGRFRFVKKGPDGYLYAATNNTDGRGSPDDGDDILLRIDPSVFDSE